MNEKTITCFFCFEEFRVYLEIDEAVKGKVTEIYDCEVCCNPNKLTFHVSNGEISIISVGDGNA